MKPTVYPEDELEKLKEEVAEQREEIIFLRDALEAAYEANDILRGLSGE